MKCGQHIIFDEIITAECMREYRKNGKVHDIYENPDKYDEKYWSIIPLLR